MAEAISVHLKHRGMTHVELATLTKLNPTTIWGAVTCRHQPNRETRRRIAAALQLPGDDLWDMLIAERQLRVADAFTSTAESIGEIRRKRLTCSTAMTQALQRLRREIQKLEKENPAIFENQPPPKPINKLATSAATKQQHAGPPPKPCMFRLKRRKSRKPQTSCGTALS